MYLGPFLIASEVPYPPQRPGPSPELASELALEEILHQGPADAAQARDVPDGRDLPEIVHEALELAGVSGRASRERDRLPQLLPTATTELLVPVHDHMLPAPPDRDGDEPPREPTVVPARTPLDRRAGGVGLRMEKMEQKGGAGR